MDEMQAPTYPSHQQEPHFASREQIGVSDKRLWQWPAFDRGRAFGSIALASSGLSFLVTGHATQIEIRGLDGSGEFGREVVVLANGNLVVTDPGFDAPGGSANVGAVHVYRPNGVRIRTLTGNTFNDRVGSGGVVVLANGDFVVLSPNCRAGGLVDAGAVTWMSADVAVDEAVSATNSLVGGTAGDQVGSGGVVPLPNGAYVVSSPLWDRGLVVNAGAVTFGPAGIGERGTINASNSLVGSNTDDRVGRVTALPGGNYLVATPNWGNGSALAVGAVTFGSGLTGVSGAVSEGNSLIGSSAQDRIGGDDPSSVVVLANGNYVIASRFWDNGTAPDAGAVTFGSGTVGVAGQVSFANSLVGSSPSDFVGQVTALPSGDYVVTSPLWDQGAVADSGAATFGSGVAGVRGAVSSANSLVGASAGDRVGENGVTSLTGGAMVVASPSWRNGQVLRAGAVTFARGGAELIGSVSPANSLVGTSDGDHVGFGPIIALSNGNYVVASGGWRNASGLRVGAVTFGHGATGVTGPITALNSLVGSRDGESVGGGGVLALPNGNYVVLSPHWSAGAHVNLGAMTFGSGTGGTVGEVSALNSLVGSSDNDYVGEGPAVALANGDYVVASPRWRNGASAEAGAVTLGSGALGIVGIVSPANSLVGGSSGDFVGSGGVLALASGAYVALSPGWSRDGIGPVGAATFGPPTGITGAVTVANSLVGSSVGDRVGAGGYATSDGNFIISSPFWDRGAVPNAGAVTYGSGTIGVHGAVSPDNSLVGSRQSDGLGVGGIDLLSGGAYVVRSPFLSGELTAASGAFSLGFGGEALAGDLDASQSVFGTTSNSGTSHVYAYDADRRQLAVGQRASNRVVLLRRGIATSVMIVTAEPDPSFPGQPVLLTATVTASPSAPSDGEVAFFASSGERCTDTVPDAVSQTSVAFTCSIVFAEEGSRTIFSEYLRSASHAYGTSSAEPHLTSVGPILSDGFEGR